MTSAHNSRAFVVEAPGIEAETSTPDRPVSAGNPAIGVAAVLPTPDANRPTPHAASDSLAEPTDPVDVALATALDRASAAGEWSAVALLARELEARRTSRSAKNVVQLRRSLR